jgi:hypothetical protein
VQSFGVFTHSPVAASHESTVQASASSQLFFTYVHLFAWHESVVQAFPSLQDGEHDAGTCTHPTAGSHESVVAALPSSQLTGWCWALPSAAEQVSAVHGLPSLTCFAW